MSISDDHKNFRHLFNSGCIYIHTNTSPRTGYIKGGLLFHVPLVTGCQ